MFLFVRELTGNRRGGIPRRAGVRIRAVPIRHALRTSRCCRRCGCRSRCLGFHRFFDDAPRLRRWPAARPPGSRRICRAVTTCCSSARSCAVSRVGADGRRLWRDAGVGSRWLAAAFVARSRPRCRFCCRIWSCGGSVSARDRSAETDVQRRRVRRTSPRTCDMWLWGRIVRAWPEPEGSLFPGLTVCAARVAAVASCGDAVRDAPVGRPAREPVLGGAIAAAAVRRRGDGLRLVAARADRQAGDQDREPQSRAARTGGAHGAAPHRLDPRATRQCAACSHHRQDLSVDHPVGGCDVVRSGNQRPRTTD